MSCPLCTKSLTPESVAQVHRACGPCQRQIKQMRAGFHGVLTEPRPQKSIWDNTAAYAEWVNSLEETDMATVHIRKKDEYVIQRCDLRDMKRIVGLPKFLPLEDQVYTAWINEGVKDEKIQEVLGLSYSQLVHVKKVIRVRLQKQMSYFHTIKRLSKDAK